MAYMHISIQQVEQHPKFKSKVSDKKEVFKKVNTENKEELSKVTAYDLEDLVYDLGLDTSRDYEVLECYHRSKITGDIIFGEHWTGWERTDEEWKKFKKEHNISYE